MSHKQKLFINTEIDIPTIVIFISKECTHYLELHHQPGKCSHIQVYFLRLRTTAFLFSI